MWWWHQQHFGLNGRHHIPHAGIAQYRVQYAVVLDTALYSIGYITVQYWIRHCVIPTG